ncbi:hypothetical protein Cni_G11576 [Canna indica]|uniref:Uncharacterized protein n=1 Tax=Canna indica TaxID=4628 RepID=A0AAQ3K6C8_9LILI|nr:hypothetical protein Cni_G11576 [Canna indica]
MRSPCCDKQETNKGAWSKEEDQKLIDYIRAHGEVSWRSVPKAAGLLRCGKSCRLRWINYLHPDVKRGNFEEDEEDLIIKLHALLGNRWSLIAGRLPGRTDNEVKNYWNSPHLRKKLKSMGVDPDNHRVTHNTAFRRSQSSNNNTATGSTTDGVANSNVNEQRVELRWAPLDSFNAEENNPNDDNVGLPDDLNLDLTIAVPSCTQLVEKSQGSNNDFTEAKTMAKTLLENTGKPTLLLFR